MTAFISKFMIKLDKPLWGLSFFYICSVALLWNSSGTALVDDSLGILNNFQKTGWSDFLNSYGMTSLYFLHDAFSNLMFSLIGKSNLIWYLFMLVFHSSAAYFFYRFCFVMLTNDKNKNSRWISLFSSILFLLSAYLVENIMWLATYHYAVTILYIMYTLCYIAVRNGKLNGVQKIALMASYASMLTMHEIILIFPLAFLALMFYFRLHKETKINKWELLSLVFAFFFVDLIYFGLTKYLKGSYIPHYGEDHTTFNGIYSLGYTFYQYLAKYILFIHKYNFSIREKIYDVDRNTIMICIGVLSGLISGLIAYYKPDLRANKLPILIALFLLIFFIPISNMYFNWHFLYINDRLGYFFSPFLYFLFVYFLFKLDIKIAVGLCSIFLALNYIILRISIIEINESKYFTENILTKSYVNYLDKSPYILNLPFSYKGFYSLRKTHRLNSLMYFFHSKDINYRYTTSMPFFRSTDSIEIKRMADSIFHIELRAPESWLMKESLGGSDYENEEVKVNYADDNQSAMIYLKNYDRSQPILYCTGSRGFVEYK
jgi:hypothetical protein